MKQEQEWILRQQRLARLLRQRIRRLGRRQEKILADLDRARGWEDLRRKGELLRVHRTRVGRGPHVTVPDYYGRPGERVTIALDLALSIDGNAERYFKEARKMKRGLPIIERRLAETEAELKHWVTALERLLATAEPEGLERMQAAYDFDRLKPPSPRARPRAAEGTPRLEPRRFLSSDGREILVGRSSAGNEHLTFHLARPHDLWLHVEGYGGSHVVVRNPKGQSLPPRTLREAAQIAAFFSKARQAGKVPVHHTFARFVRRAKGRKPGTVLITQEKTVVVTPEPGLIARLGARRQTGAGRDDTVKRENTQ